jgi:hypothetical protein
MGSLHKMYEVPIDIRDNVRILHELHLPTCLSAEEQEYCDDGCKEFGYRKILSAYKEFILIV